jgi:hypothetical protein
MARAGQDLHQFKSENLRSYGVTTKEKATNAGNTRLQRYRQEQRAIPETTRESQAQIDKNTRESYTNKHQTVKADKYPEFSF